MLVINENNRRLLNMKAKLLEFTNGDSRVLEEYEKLVKEIDNDCYNQIVNKIKKSNYNALSLEEQISFLSEIEADYNYLNELQWMFRNTYNKYASGDIELCNINNILINNIISRISDIHGYLMNIKNLNSNKLEVDKLNNKLISLEKEKEQIKRLFNDIRSKLKNEITNAEGRIHDSNGSLVPISINSELKKYGISLHEILNDHLKLERVYKAFSEEAEMLEEKYRVTIDLPNRDEEICHQIEIDMIKGKYKLALVQLIKEISAVDSEYSSFRDRLYKIASVIDDLKNDSVKLGIRFYINPFDRIKIDSQIQVINSIKDIDKETDNIRKTITYITAMIDDSANKNNELITLINTDINIFSEDNYYNLMDENKAISDENKKTFSDIVSDTDVKGNQVIKIGNPKDEFKRERVKEKTKGVIERVFEMMSSVPVETSQVISPELVLDCVSKEAEDSNKDVTIMEDMESIFPESGESTQELINSNNNNIFLDSSIGNNNQIFSDVTPFEEAPLFSGRDDLGISEMQPKMVVDLGSKNLNHGFENNAVIRFDKTKNDDVLGSMMPEAFWVTKETETTETQEEPLSIDQQVAKMMNDTNQTKGKVA